MNVVGKWAYAIPNFMIVKKHLQMDHSLKKGEHLVFIFITNDCFIIHIFAKFGFEKVIIKGLLNKG